MINVSLEISEPFSIIKNGTIYNMYDKILIIVLFIAILEIICFISKKQYKKIVNVILMLLIDTIVYRVGHMAAREIFYLNHNTFNDACSASNATFIIIGLLILTIQLIPFITCLKNNKKIKKDEVKQ